MGTWWHMVEHVAHLHPDLPGRMQMGRLCPGSFRASSLAQVLEARGHPRSAEEVVLGVVVLRAKGVTLFLSSSLFQSGMIRTQEADYFLKPLPPHLVGSLQDSAGAGPPSHILYKRSTEVQAPGAPQAVLTRRDRELGNQPLRSGSSLQHPQKQHFCGRRKKCM